MVVICRAGLARNTRKLIKHISYEAEAIGANMRTANILGDRILARPLKGNDRNHYVLGIGFLMIIRGAYIWDGNLELRRRFFKI